MYSNGLRSIALVLVLTYSFNSAFALSPCTLKRLKLAGIVFGGVGAVIGVPIAGYKLLQAIDDRKRSRIQLEAEQLALDEQKERIKREKEERLAKKKDQVPSSEGTVVDTRPETGSPAAKDPDVKPEPKVTTKPVVTPKPEASEERPVVTPKPVTAPKPEPKVEKKTTMGDKADDIQAIALKSVSKAKGWVDGVRDSNEAKKNIQSYWDSYLQTRGFSSSSELKDQDAIALDFAKFVGQKFRGPSVTKLDK